MTKIKTTIYVIPTAKGRPRSTIVHGHVKTYTPAKTRRAESDIMAMIRLQLRETKVFYYANIPLRIEATFYRERPKTLAKRATMPVQRPDLDNYMKLLTDSLEKYIYKNDSQICTALIKKRFGDPPRIELLIEVDED